MTCTVCGEPIDSREPVWEEIIAWKQQKKAALKLKKQTGSVMCATCMVRVENGMPQKTLFDELGAR